MAYAVLGLYVACKAVNMQRPRDKYTELFIGNGSVHTIPQRHDSNNGTDTEERHILWFAQRRGKHTSATTNPYTTIEELCFLLVRAAMS
jgi:hypothetical protein